MPQRLTHADLVGMSDRIAHTLSSEEQDRLRRALSWLQRAELADPHEVDEKFLFLWIAFAAAYSPNAAQRDPNTAEFMISDKFFRQMVLHDRERLLRTIMSEQLNTSIELLVGNEFLYEPFWNDAKNWQVGLREEVAKMRKSLHQQYVAPTFKIVLRRLHVLRNQVIHGGATWRSKVNRAQMQAGVDIMSQVTPAILRIMLGQKERNRRWRWPSVSWPRLEPGVTPAPRPANRG